MSLKVGLCSAGSTGKTTLLKPLSEALNVGIFNLTTNSVMEKFNLKSQNDAVAVAGVVPAIGINFQSQLIKDRFDYFFDVSNIKDQDFVTDRTPLDSLAYYMIHNCYWDTEEHTDELIEIIRNSRKLYDYIFCLPTGVIPVENDGRRGLNPYYHSLVQRCIFWLAGITLTRLIEVPRSVVSIEDRVNWIKSFIIMDKIKRLLRLGVVKVEFLKKDGTVREMNATLKQEVLQELFPDNDDDFDITLSNENVSAARVIDLDINEWRSFRISSITKINGKNVDLNNIINVLDSELNLAGE